MMQPAKLGFAEVHYGAARNKIIPKMIPGFWYKKELKIPYIVQMNLFLEHGINPRSVFYTKDNVNKMDALMHLESIKNSALLTMKDKKAVCSFLSSLWFKFINILP